MEAKSFVAQLIILNHPGKLKVGYTPVIHVHTAHVACRVEAILAKFDRKSGQKLEDNPEFLKAGDNALVRFVPVKPLCIEPFSAYPPLGRFIVRDLRQIIAIGAVEEVTKKIHEDLVAD